MIVAKQRNSSYVSENSRAEERLNLYILRHAPAVGRETTRFTDDERPLTTEGIRKMQKEAECFPSLVGPIDVIFTSPLSRAQETAEIAARYLGYKGPVRRSDSLKPGSSCESVTAELNSVKKENVMIVGHEPDVSRLTAQLVGGEGVSIEFKKGALCLISFNGPVKPGGGILRFLLQPKQLRALTA